MEQATFSLYNAYYNYVEKCAVIKFLSSLTSSHYSSIPLFPFIPLPLSPFSLALSLLRKYQAANLSINLFFVDSRFAFSYAWCVGAQSVTTNNCKELASMSENRFYQV